MSPYVDPPPFAFGSTPFGWAALATLLTAALLISGCGSTDDDNGEEDRIDCSLVDEIYYLHGGSSGPCTDSDLTVDTTGQVAWSWNQPISGGVSCPDAQSDTTTVTAGEAQTLLDMVCQSYNETYTTPDSCDGAWAYVTFRQGSSDLAVTGNLSCGGAIMTEALDALTAFEQAL
ncbi:MAG: hypothetical protein DRI90_09205 [Deltaproteobacteria bacterium]|nr:MAG: hypothetical protein DRI90_09205 [Deltaproteobacteria bacterium]